MGARVLFGLVVACLLPLSAATAGDAEAVFALAVTEDDIDLQATQHFRHGQAEQPAPAKVFLALGLLRPSRQVEGWWRKWSAGSAGGRKRRNEGVIDFQYRIAFQRPIAVGSVLCSNQEVRFLKPDAPYPGDPAKEDQWVEVEIPPRQGPFRLAAFPVDTKTRALLLTDRIKDGRSDAHPIRIYQRRLHNVASTARAAANRTYHAPRGFGGRSYPPLNPIRGRGTWLSNGKNDEGDIVGPYISTVEPAWYTLAWDKPQPVVGLVQVDNFRKVKLDHFAGGAATDPLLGVEGEWDPIRSHELAGQVLHGRSDYGRWTTFSAPIETRGLRQRILGTWAHKGGDSQVAALEGLLAVRDLGTAPVPEVPADGPPRPPYKIPYALERYRDFFTLAIDTPDGRRVRNLVARVPRTAGQQDERWELKDEDGRCVPPGTYRWKAVAGPWLKLRYEQSAYPNVTVHHPENSAWLNGHSGSGGWLADHSPPRGGASSERYNIFTAPVPESGVGFAVCDLSGKKLWGIHSFSGWTGGNRVAIDGEKAYVESFGWHEEAAGYDRIWEVDLQTQETRQLLNVPGDEQRVRGGRGLAAHGGKLYLSVQGRAKWLVNACGAAAVDIYHCVPRYEPQRPPKRKYEVVPDPRGDFLRLFRLTSYPPGYSPDHGLTFLESTKGPGNKQHIVIAFKKPVAVGSCIYPVPEHGDIKVKLSVLKPEAEYPPDADRNDDWLAFEKDGQLPWDIGIAPEDTRTRALRITFQKGPDDALADVMEEMEAEGAGGGLGLGGDDGGLSLGLGNKTSWMGRLEGMQILRRRYRNRAGEAKVRTSSGQLSKDAWGETWTAQRDKPLSPSDPAIYMLEWDQPVPLRGLAIKEIDAARAEIDVWTGPAGAPVKLDGEQHWQTVGTHVPRRRVCHVNMDGHNADARYMDGTVDFGRPVETRAVRLRMVAQWTVNTRKGSCAKGRLGLNPNRCRVFGVAALEYIGGEAPVSPLMAERLEVIDPASGNIEQEIQIEEPSELTTASDGTLYALSGHKLVRVSLDGGAHTVLVDDLRRPLSLAVDAAGFLYVFDADPERRNIRVYHADGTLKRTIGEPGGYVPGPWNPHCFMEVTSLSIDGEGKLWAVDNFYWPKRVSCWTQEGEFLRDYLGPTQYGGGGVLDPGDKTRLVYGPLEFELDWETGTSRLKNYLTAPDRTWSAGEVPIRVEERTYFVNRPTGSRNTVPVGFVSLYEKDHLRLVAAMGHASGFPPFRNEVFAPALKGKTLPQLEFIWIDRNGDGRAQPAETVFEPRRVHKLTHFNRDLGVQAGRFRYAVNGFLDNGAPVYEKREYGFRFADRFRDGQAFRLDNGLFYCRGSGYPDYAINAQGETVWTYPNEGSGVGPDRSCKPYTPEQVVCQFGIVGHETAAGGQLGEFFVLNANLGSWNVWTADGLLAARIMRDNRDPKRLAWTMPEHDRRMALDDLTAGQEHFQGWFCRHSPDGKYYIVAGHNHASIVEVIGIDDFDRLGGTLTITPEDIKAAQAYEREMAHYKAEAEVKVIDARPIDPAPLPSGKSSAWDNIAGTMLPGGGITFKIAYDSKYLFLYYEADKSQPPLRNSGNQWQQLFKTGGCMDIMIGVDESAAPDRQAPVAGDQRVLITRVKGKPIAVLYRPVNPGATATHAWEAVSPVARVHFDEVRRLADAIIRYRENTSNEGGYRGGYTLEAAIPLTTLGLSIAKNKRLQFDWGYLEPDRGGSSILARRYWANQATSTLADVPSEARLEPQMWGTLRFLGAAQRGTAGGELLGNEEDGPTEKEIMLELEGL